MINIKTLNNISETGLKFLNTNRYAVSNDCENPDAILLRSYDMLNYEFNKNLTCIGRAGAGVNNIPVDRCTDEGIVVFNTPGANANAVKELVLCSILLGARKIHEGISWTENVTENKDLIHKTVEKEKAKFAGSEVLGKKLGVIGLGAIGALCANSAIALGMEVIGYDPYISVDAAWSLSTQVQKSTDLDELFRVCDYITLHVPYMESTKDTINKIALEKCKDGVVILNFARGELVNNQDIINAVKRGKVSKYITDFPKEELLGIENIITVPHLGASTFEAEENCAFMAVKQVKDYIEYGNITNSVNFPPVNMPFNADTRITIINKNMPKVVGNVTSILADESINIADMINKSRGEIAYTIIDINGDINDSVVEKIKAVSGVVNVRIIK